MNESKDLTPEDQKLERLLDLLDSGTALDAVYAGELDEEESLSLEMLASLPYALEPEATDPRTKIALLQRLEKAAEAEVIPFRRSAVASPPPRRDGRFLAMAAALAISLLGTSLIGLRLQDQRGLVEQLQADLTAAQEQRIQTTAGVADSAIPLYRVGITTSSQEIQKTDAVIFICGPHEHWYLNVREMESPPEGMSYHLWFLTDQKAVHAGILNVEHSAQTVHSHLPKDLRGILITLESSEVPQRPEGRHVLRGDQTIML